MKEIPIATLGQTPRTVTETAGELLRHGTPLSEIVMIRTGGSRSVPDAVRRMLPQVPFEDWREIPAPGTDVLTPEDAGLMARTIFNTVAACKRCSDVGRIHLDLTGGRKTMSAYALLAYEWPGNVRELKFVMQAMIAQTHTSDPIITVESLPLWIAEFESMRLADTGFSEAVRQACAHLDPKTLTREEIARYADDLRRALFVMVYRHNRGNLKGVARQLGISRSTLYLSPWKGWVKELKDERAKGYPTGRPLPCRRSCARRVSSIPPLPLL